MGKKPTKKKMLPEAPERQANPDPLSTVLLSSAVGGAAMQVGGVIASKLIENTFGNKEREENPGREANPLGNLPPKAARMWEHVYESAQERGLSKSASAAQAWCSVKRHYYRKEEGGRWYKRKKPLSQDEYPPGCEPYEGRAAANPYGRPGPAWEPTGQVGVVTDWQREHADFAIRRWKHLAPWQEDDLTWREFARRIRATGDPGSLETAEVIETIPGYVKDWAITVDNPGEPPVTKKSVRKLKAKLLK